MGAARRRYSASEKSFRNWGAGRRRAPFEGVVGGRGSAHERGNDRRCDDQGRDSGMHQPAGRNGGLVPKGGLWTLEWRHAVALTRFRVIVATSLLTVVTE